MRKSYLLLMILLVNLFLSTTGDGAFIKSLLNNLFLTSLLLLMIGSSLFLLETGFFNGLIHGFKQYYNKVSSIGRYVEEETKEGVKVVPFVFSSTHMFLKVGITLFVTTVLIGFIF